MEDEKYKALKAQLDLTPWPEVYMFKFIVPNDLHKVSQLEGMFNHDTSKISTRESKKGNYVSFTATELMMSTQAVLDRYQLVGQVEGIMSL
jgi:hypothetical protein